MHSPPPAQSDTGRSTAHLVVIVAAAFMNGLLLVALSGSVLPGAWIGWAGLSMGLAVYSLVGWLRSPAGVLRWTGSQWSWGAVDRQVLCELYWSLDLQVAALVRFRPWTQPAQPVWFWLQRGDQSVASWSALRRALVYGAHHHAAMADGEPGAVGPTNFLSRYLIGRRTPQLRASRTGPVENGPAGALQDSNVR